MSKYKDADRLMAILTKRCVEASNQEAWFAYARACGDVRDLPAADVVEVVRCKDCKWGREVCGNIECFVDRNILPEYHGYEWFCPNGERRTDE